MSALWASIPLAGKIIIVMVIVAVVVTGWFIHAAENGPIMNEDE